LLLSVGKGTVAGDPNAVWAAYYAAQAQPAAAYPTYQAAVQPTLQSVTGQQAAAAAAGPYAATLSRAAVTPQPSTFIHIPHSQIIPRYRVTIHLVKRKNQGILKWSRKILTV